MAMTGGRQARNLNFTLTTIEIFSRYKELTDRLTRWCVSAIQRLVMPLTHEPCLSLQADAEVKEAFALFDKKGTGRVPRESLGDLLRALGQNPTQAEVAELASKAPAEIDFNTFNSILNRPNGFKPAGTAGEQEEM